MDRGGDQRDGQQSKATGCDGRRRSGRNHCQDSVNQSRSFRDFDPSGPLVTVLSVCLVGFQGYHPNYNVVIIKPAASRLAQQNPSEKFILPMITIL